MGQNLHVLYNDRCPICRAEIEHYRAYTQAQDLSIRFEDLHEADLSRWGVDAAGAAKRLHVRHGDGVLSGVDAFIALWREMPRYRFLARVVALPGIRPLAGWVYNKVLAPWLYRRHVRRENGAS